MADRYVISGKKLSKLASGNPAKDDLFILADAGQQDYSLTYGSLSADMMNKLRVALELDSMAYELSTDWAFSSHLHNYSKVRVKPFYGEDGVASNRGKSVSTLFTIGVSDETEVEESYTVCMPVEDIKLPEIYKIGEMRFLARTAATLPNVTSLYFANRGGSATNPCGAPAADFDGWVYADGKYYMKQYFPEAYELYKDGTSSTAFRVPDFRDFIKGNPRAESASALVRQPAVLGLAPHSHTVTADGNGAFSGGSIAVNCVISAYGTGGYSKDTGWHSHSSKGTTEKTPITQLTCNADMSKFSIPLGGHTTTEAGSASSATEVYPEYDSIPAMIYIGRGTNNG